jgi:hypothetical protein
MTSWTTVFKDAQLYPFHPTDIEAKILKARNLSLKPIKQQSDGFLK